MKKSDLKTGMWVVNRSGKWAIVLLNTDDGDIISGDTWSYLDNFDEDLNYQTFYDSSDITYNASIMKIYQPSCNKDYCYYNKKYITESDLIWERL